MIGAQQAAVAAARAWLGTPFVHQASLRGAGCDCLGLIRGLWRELIGPEPLPVPAYGRGWPGTADGGEALIAGLSRVFRPAAGGADVPGRLLVFRMRRGLPAGHAAIACGAGRLIHAREPLGVVEEALTRAWAHRLAAVFDWPAMEGPR